MNNLTETFTDLAEKYEEIIDINENLSNRLLALEDIGWELVMGADKNDGPTLDQLKRQSGDLQDMVVSSPFMKRGCQLRHAYIFGRGVNYDAKTAKGKSFLEDTDNRAALFSVGAYETMNAALFTDGNFFVLRDSDNDLTTVPLAQITGVVTNPNDASKIQYLKRSWSVPSENGQSEVQHMWYPLHRYDAKMRKQRKKLATTLGQDKTKVSKTTVIHHQTAFRMPGWTFGVPDSLAAKVWTIAYGSYLKDNSMLVKALSQFAWKVTTSSKTAQDSAASSVSKPGVGGTAVMGEGNNLQAIPRSGSDVNFNNGQPLAAAIATSLGVPVIALLSSPGAGSGSYGAATTLDEPTLKGMAATQESWRDFQLEIIRSVDPKATLDYPAISTDATYRQIASLGIAQSGGMIHQQEARNRVVELLDITVTDESLPKPEHFNTWNDPRLLDVDLMAQAPDSSGDNNPNPGQGKSGSVPGGVSQSDTNHDGDND